MEQSPGEGKQSLFRKGVIIPIFYQVLVSMIFVAMIPVILLLVVSMGGTESFIGTIGTSATVLILTIGTILVVFMWSYFVAHHVTQPIVELSSIATRISRGYVPEGEIEVRSNDEIGELVIAFNKMVNTYRILDTLAKEEAETEQ
ncbi:MAG: HAMP domain protein [Methanoregulaceae archaeon PtaB.Bin108]|nr:MAG: HAMP domain protein [Methanoregulaceae archaeon PtaB.Bin108]